MSGWREVGEALVRSGFISPSVACAVPVPFDRSAVPVDRPDPLPRTGPLDHRDRPRVAVTGIGVVTPAGWELPVFWRTLLAGRGTATPVERSDTRGLPTRFACQLPPGFDPGRYLAPKTLRRSALFTQYAAVAALDALAQAAGPRAPGPWSAVRAAGARRSGRSRPRCSADGPPWTG
ncbi:hypothetical protein H9Y04_10285 [Streptomyces sp. TRM66268-LWL]|uniref:Beta-ketoacyl synthase-like N-terminal domain-containing protein n=1 Tax=Streptomyces polyasparticus TaxID=2767826 RepID=A0ABR7SBV3_9ACTN|nr:beta-ketoacyl synthase N-terminal-like domain-containing protein [Streptomyces polyasparticus]MBC9712956.1 hypothetical protein [Streptomyces polyasparticus]